jgi:Family of unknown function (DUF6962)
MEFVTVPTELTTAATDACLALLALISASYLFHFRRLNPWKILLWCWILFLLALGSILGVFVHGFRLAPTTFNLLWFLLYLSLALAVALFVSIATYDGWGLSASRRLLPFVLLAGCVFTIIAQLIINNFLFFILYEGVAMLFALGVYLRLAIWRQAPGASLITCGILLTILAAIAQTIHSIVFTVIWQFNYNGLFHLIQMAGIVFLVVGVRRSVLSQRIQDDGKASPLPST